MKKIDKNHEGKRAVLRFIGIILILIGGGFILVGVGSFFSSFGSFGPPKYFWCAFVGMPMLFVGLVCSSYGFMGAVARYSAEEIAPVGKDTFNYMADGTKEGVKTVAAAVGEGLRAGSLADVTSEGIRCFKCNEINKIDSKFCDQCGAALQKTKSCPACNEINDPDAKFCDNCGQAF